MRPLASTWLVLALLLVSSGCPSTGGDYEPFPLALEAVHWDLDLSESELAATREEIALVPDAGTRGRLRERADEIQGQIRRARAAAEEIEDASGIARLDPELDWIRDQIGQLKHEALGGPD